MVGTVKFKTNLNLCFDFKSNIDIDRFDDYTVQHKKYLQEKSRRLRKCIGVLKVWSAKVNKGSKSSTFF